MDFQEEDMPDDPFSEEEHTPDPLVTLGAFVIVLLCTSLIFLWVIMALDILRHL